MHENSGFTLIELILVVVIIGILAGTVTLQFTGRAEEARINRAKMDISNYGTAVDLYALDHNDKYPQNLQALKTDPKREYVKEYVKDPWGNDYVYLNPGKRNKRSYDLYSKGPDGLQDTEDDVTPWETDEGAGQ